MKKLFLIFLLFVILGFVWMFFPSQEKQKPVVIKFSSWGSQSEIKLLKPLISEFEKENPDIKIEFLHIPQNYFQKLHLLFASNLAPDVIFVNNYYAPKYINAGLFEDLSGYFDKEKYFEKSYLGFSDSEKIYVIPRDISNLVIYYNKNLFKRYNVPYPKKDWTLEEFLKTAQKLTQDINNDGKTDIWGVSFEKDLLFLLPYLFSNGASVLSDDGTKIEICEKEAVDTIDFYSGLINKYKVAPSKSDSASLTSAQMFLQGKLAMQLSGRWLVPKYREQAQFDWDIVQFPAGTQGSIVNIDASGYALSKNSKHKTEAIKFIQFISSEKSLKHLTKSGLIVPARKEVAYSSVFLEEGSKPQNARVFADIIETGKVTPVNDNYQRLNDKLSVILEPVYLGQKKAEEVLTKDFIKDFSK